MDIGRVGIWTTLLDRQPASVARSLAAELEELGYGAIWVGEAVRREPFVNSAILLGATRRVVVATGIANVWARDAQAMAAGQLSLAEAFDGRFLLGIGVSHQALVSRRGHSYERPYQAMVEYLDGMGSAVFDAPAPRERPPLILAALGPRMLRLSAERADGAHPYFVPVAHTEQARSLLGQGKLLCPEQAVVLDGDPQTARELARRHTSAYLRLPNYTRNLLRLGFDEADFTGGGSDRLVDALVAWGDVRRVAARINEHLDAGADHVAVQVLVGQESGAPQAAWRDLAGELGLSG